jgi:hypothetical protein
LNPQKPRPPLGGRPSRPTNRRRSQPARPESQLTLWIVIGAVVVVLGGALYVVKSSASSANDDSATGRTPAKNDSGEDTDVASASEPSDVETESFEEDMEPYSTSPSVESGERRAPVDESDSGRQLTVADLIRERDAKSRARMEKSDAAAAAAARAAGAMPAPDAPAGENPFFTLELSGNLGGTSLDPQDPQTWARLSYFLHDEAPSRFYLVYPNGSIPRALPRAGGVASARKNEVKETPAGDTSKPTYRLVISATSGAGGPVTFYGKVIGSKYNCTIHCRVEKRQGADFALVQETSVEESSTPAKGNGPSEDVATYPRRVYDVALDKLARQLQGLAVFRAK